MPPKSPTEAASWTTLLKELYESLNWFRIHLLVFTLLPLLFSGFFSAANPSQAKSAADGSYITQYIDSLLMCFSAMTQSGVSTVSVSQVNTAQQAFLFVLFIVGHISTVSLVTLLCRLVWWNRYCKRIVNSTALDDLYRHNGATIEKRLEDGRSSSEDGLAQDSGERQDDRESGEIEEGSRDGFGRQDEVSDDEQPSTHDGDIPMSTRRRWDAADTRPNTGPRDEDGRPHLRPRRRLSSDAETSNHSDLKSQAKDRHASVAHASSGLSRHSGRGGFPGIHQLLPLLLRLISPKSHSYISNTLRQGEYEAEHTPHPLQDIGKAIKRPFKDKKAFGQDRQRRAAKWLPRGVRGVVTNEKSQFFEEELGEEDLEILGVLEYRATKLMAYILIAHIVFWIMIPSSIIAIYFAKVHYWDTNFIANGGTQIGNVHTTWYSFYQGASAFTSCGLSLVDELMVPFQNCFLLIYILMLPMLAGNQALPLLVRFETWLLTKIVTEGTEVSVLLHFLLTHGRRVTLYIFPAYQSWWLFANELFLWAIGLVFFIAFNQNLGYYDTLGPPFQRFSIGLFQSLCARATGFDIVQMAYLAPATPFLYLLLIFTSNYPVVMGIRSTNVYEERALGLNGEHAPGKHNNKKQNQKGHIYSKYLKQHLLPQIYFDLWPVFLATLLILVIERTILVDPNNSGWTGVFQILFEVTSAYANVGLTYSNPFNTSSLTATFRNLSKFIIVVVMLRGRHRGLPLAIDRATMFPIEYERLSRGERKQLEADRIQQAGEEAED